MNFKNLKKILIIHSMVAVTLIATSCSSFDIRLENSQRRMQQQLFQMKEKLDNQWNELFDAIKDSTNKFFFINETIQVYFRKLRTIQNEILNTKIVLDPDIDFAIPKTSDLLNRTNDETLLQTNVKKQMILKKYFDTKKNDSLISYSRKSSILSLDVESQLKLHSVQLGRDNSEIQNFLNVYKNIKMNVLPTTDEIENLRRQATANLGKTRDEIRRALLDPNLANLTPEQFDQLNKIVNPDDPTSSSKHTQFHSHALINIMNELIMLISNSFNDTFIRELKELKKDLKNANLVNDSDLEFIDNITKIIENKTITPIWLDLSQKTNDFINTVGEIANFTINDL